MRGHRTRTEFTAHLRKCAKPKSKGYFLTDADRARILRTIEDSPALDGIKATHEKHMQSLGLRANHIAIVDRPKLSCAERLMRAFDGIF